MFCDESLRVAWIAQQCGMIGQGKPTGSIKVFQPSGSHPGFVSPNIKPNAAYPKPESLWAMLVRVRFNYLVSRGKRLSASRRDKGRLSTQRVQLRRIERLAFDFFVLAGKAWGSCGEAACSK